MRETAIVSRSTFKRPTKKENESKPIETTYKAKALINDEDAMNDWNSPAADVMNSHVVAVFCLSCCCWLYIFCGVFVFIVVLLMLLCC